MNSIHIGAALDPVGIEAFTARYFGRSFLHVPGSARRFEDLFSWTALGNIVTFHQFDGGRLRLMKDGQLISKDLFCTSISLQSTHLPTVSAPDLNKQLREGATLVVDGVDFVCPSVQAFAQTAERILNCGVHVNAYAGWRESPGLSLHWDRHDVLVLQIGGRKHWLIYGPTRTFPMQSDVAACPEPQGEPVWEGILSPGDVLYIPRGWWHIATPCNEPSLHLTVGLTLPTAADALRWFAHRLKNHELMRRDMPVCGEGASEYFAEVGNLVAEACRTGEFLSLYMENLRATAPPRSCVSFPRAVTDFVSDAETDKIHWMVPRRLEIEDVEDGNIGLLFNSKRLVLKREAACVIRFLDELTPVSVARLYNEFDGRFDRDMLDDLLANLAKEGAVAFTPE